MSALLYSERASALGKLMEKIGQNIDLALENRRNEARFCANELCAADYGSRTALETSLNSAASESGSVPLVLVDSEGVCRSADGTAFRWGDAEALAEERALVSLVPGREEEQILFPARLPGALACGMSSLDRVFDVRDFGEASVAYLIRENGSRICGQEKLNGLSGLYNVTAFLGFQETVRSAWEWTPARS